MSANTLGGSAHLVRDPSSEARAARLRGFAAVGLAGLLAFGAIPAASAQFVGDIVPDLGLGVDASIGYLYDNNVTRAPTGPDKLSDQFYSLNASKTFAFPITDFSRLTVDVFGGGELARFHSGLGNIFGGIQPALQYRGSTDFDAPTFSVFFRGLGEHFGSELRSGWRYSAGVSVRQPITDTIGVFAAYAHNWRYAKSTVFYTRDNSVLASIDATVAPYGTLTLSGEYRRGTLVSTGQKTLTIIDIAQAFVNDDVFTSPQMIDYRFEAKSWLTTVDWNLPLGARSALDFSWRWTHSTSTENATFPGGGPLKYTDNQFNVVYLFRF